MRLHQDKAEIVKYSQSTIASTSFWRNEANFNRKLIALDFGGVFLGWGRFFFFLGTKGLGENGDSCVVDFRGRNTKTKRALLEQPNMEGLIPIAMAVAWMTLHLSPMSLRRAGQGATGPSPSRREGLVGVRGCTGHSSSRFANCTC